MKGYIDFGMSYPYSHTGTNRFIGRPYFYADAETGIGWESKIDIVFHSSERPEYILELSGGTRVSLSYREMKQMELSGKYTNMENV